MGARGGVLLLAAVASGGAAAIGAASPAESSCTAATNEAAARVLRRGVQPRRRRTAGLAVRRLDALRLVFVRGSGHEEHSGGERPREPRRVLRSPPCPRGSPPRPDGGWAGTKVLWSTPRYTGPVLIRGGRLDGPGEVGFDLGPAWTGTVQPELRFSGPERTLHPAATYVRAAGCYTYQLDTYSSTSLIVFEARIG